MRRSIARWTTSVATAALLVMPAAGLAQTPPQPPPPTGDPTQSQPPAPDQRVTSGVDQDAAKQHLTEARNTLSEITQLPAAAQLTGDARTQISELISNFNELITTKAMWRSSYAKLEANLNALIGADASAQPTPPASGTPGAVGTSGIAALDPEIRSKLVEFRNHLQKFEQAAGGSKGSPSAPAATADQPGQAAHPATHPAGQAHSDQPAGEMNQDEILRHIDAIEAILGVQSASSAASHGTPPATTAGTGATTATGTPTTTGTPAQPPQSTVGTSGTTPAILTLDQAQLDQLRHHLTELRRLVKKQRD